MLTVIHTGLGYLPIVYRFRKLWSPEYRAAVEV